MERVKNNGLAFVGVEVREKPHAQIDPKAEMEAEKQKISQAKKKGGRKSMSYDVKAEVDFVKRDKAIHEPFITDITFSSTDKNLVRELAVRQLLTAYDMTEDYAAKILCFMYDESVVLNNHKVYCLGNQKIADSLGLSYPTVQKIVQKMNKKSVILKDQILKNGYIFKNAINMFLESISNNAQILLTFKAIEEEQLEAINKDGSLNEDMVK